MIHTGCVTIIFLPLFNDDILVVAFDVVVFAAVDAVAVAAIAVVVTIANDVDAVAGR